MVTKKLFIGAAVAVVACSTFMTHARLTQVIFSVKGMTCEACATGLKNKLLSLHFIREIESVDFQSGTVQIALMPDNNQTQKTVVPFLMKAVMDAGFTFDKIESTQASKALYRDADEIDNEE